MNKGLSYYDYFKHPEWQKKRLKIMELANFECESCGAKDITLHVHHKYYEKGRKPWEYPDESLHCLCEDCHKEIQDIQVEMSRQIGRLDLSDLGALLGYARGLESLSYPNVSFSVESYEEALGIASCWGISPEDVISALEDKSINGYKLDEIRKRGK